MKKKEQLKYIIRDFHTKERFDVISRDFSIPLDTGKIITLIGIRRCGKTSIMYDCINELSQKIPKEKILFLNFEDERLELDISELDLIIQAYQELYPKNDLKDCYLFFDEIQNVNGWEKFVRRVYDTLSKNIFITGSNSKLLSSEIATSLRGRTLSFEIYPLSFSEYLRFNDVKIDIYSSKSVAMIKNMQERFLLYGGFPESVFLSFELANKTMQEYFNVLIYKDLIQRYDIKNQVALKFFLKRILSSNTKQISINKIYNELKSNHIKIGKNTLYDFLDYVQNIFLALTLHKYDKSLTNQELGEKKIYTCDIGFYNAIEFNFSKNLGKSLENAVFLELKRMEKKLYFFKDEKSECDFLVANEKKIIQAMQVCAYMNDKETSKRELKGLINACKIHKQKEGWIVTLDEEDEFIQDDITIKIIPFYKWQLH